MPISYQILPFNGQKYWFLSIFHQFWTQKSAYFTWNFLIVQICNKENFWKMHIWDMPSSQLYKTVYFLFLCGLFTVLWLILDSARRGQFSTKIGVEQRPGRGHLYEPPICHTWLFGPNFCWAFNRNDVYFQEKATDAFFRSFVFLIRMRTTVDLRGFCTQSNSS